MNILLLMMGGIGSRFGADIPKQYVEVRGKPIFSYILQKYNNLADIDKIVIVSHTIWIDFVNEWVEKCEADKVAAVVAGGDTRSESVRNGLVAAHEFAARGDILLIHDATHPYVDEKGTRAVIAAVKEYGAATLAAFNYDTVYRMDKDKILRSVEERSEIVAGASPEAFTFGIIYDVYTQASQSELARMTSAGAIALAHGIKMYVTEASVLNLKITYPPDMELFTRLCDEYFFE